MQLAGFIAVALVLWLLLGGWFGRAWQRAGRPLRRWWLLWGIGGFAAASLYTLTGAPALLHLMDHPPAEATLPPAFIRELQERIAVNPQDVEALVRLAEAQLVIGRAGEAEDLYRRAVLASSGDTRLIARYGEVQVAAADGQVTESAAQSFSLIHQLQPENPTARFYLGLQAEQQHNPPLRDRYWKGLKDGLPPDHPWRDYPLP